MEKLTELCAQPSTLSRDHALAAALRSWKPADFIASADDFVELLGGEDRKVMVNRAELAEAWLDRWLEIDAPSAMRFLENSSIRAKFPVVELLGWPMEDQARNGLGGMIKAAARRNPLWTREFVAQIPQGERRDTGIYSLLNEVARIGGSQADQIIASFGEVADHRAAVAGYVSGLSERDVRSACERACVEPPGQFRDELLRTAFRRGLEVGLGELSALLDLAGDPAARALCASTALGWSEGRPPEGAVQFIKAESDRMLAAGNAAPDLSYWAVCVAEAAQGPLTTEIAEWALELGADSKRQIFQQITSRWAGREPAVFRNWLSERAEKMDPAAVQALSQQVETMARIDVSETATWAQSLPACPLRNLTQFQVALQAGKQGDVSSAKAAYRSVAGGDSDGSLAIQLAQILADRDGAEAAKWAMSQPVGKSRESAIQTVAGTWSLRNPTEAAQWLEQLPVGAERDRAVETFATNVVMADPAIAAEWAEQVGNPARREETAAQVYRAWSIHNPVAARAWLRESSGLDEGAVARIFRNTR